MPKLDSAAMKHRMAELRVSSEELAEKTGIPWGSLRNAIAGTDPLRLDRIYDVARVLAKEGEDLKAFVASLVGDDGGVPENPPDQTKPKPKPERRKEKGGSGPKRDAEQRVVA